MEPSDAEYFRWYGDLELQRRMVGDRTRTRAFAAAIEESVRPGDRVLDIGCGTGILAMLAARAGAARVVAIDQSRIAQAAANLVKANGLTDVVRVLHGPAAELELDGPVDVIVSEWLGNFALVEDMWPDISVVRDRFLRSDGIMLPAAVELYLAPVDDAVGYIADGPGFWSRPVEGFDFSSLEALELRQARAAQVVIDDAARLADPQCLAAIDCRTDGPDAGLQACTLQFRGERDGRMVGFVGWFEAQLSTNVRLSTAPGERETHWAQTFLPFPPRLVRANERITAHVRLSRDPDERRNLRLDVQVGSEEQSFRLE